MKAKIPVALVSEQLKFVHKSFSENSAGFYQLKRNPRHVTMPQVSAMAKISLNLTQTLATVMAKYTCLSSLLSDKSVLNEEFINFKDSATLNLNV
jgi:hypothetical protein